MKPRLFIPVIRSFAISAWMLFYFAGVSNAQVRLSVSVAPDPASICLNELAEYRIVLENSDATPQLRPPQFKHFTVLGSPARESGMSSVNGKVTRYIAWVYNIRPLKKGIFRIEPTRAVIGGKAYETASVNIEVKNCQASAQMQAGQTYNDYEQPGGGESLQDMMLKSGEDAEAKAKKNLALLLEVNKKSCYVGEPVEVSYLLLSRLHCESKMNRQPSFNGFSVIDLPAPNNFSTPTRTYQGKSFNVYTLRHSQAYPLQAGSIEIEPAEIENEVTFVKEDFIRQQGMTGWVDEYALSMMPREALVTKTVAVSNEPLTITVKPLPEKGRPASFDGAVGDFILESSLQKNRFALNETGLLTVVIKGSGNMTLLTPPVISWPAGVEAFEPKYREELDKTTVPVRGKKVFEIAFSVQQPGNYTIQPFRFSYFDPAAGEYKEVETEPLQLTVDPADPSLVNQVPGQIEKLSFINRIFYHRWWIIIFVAVVILSGLLIWVWRDKKETDRKMKETKPDKEIPEATVSDAPAIPEQAVNPLQASADCLESADPSDFYRVLNRELKACLCTTFSLEPSRLNLSALPDLLDRQGISPVLALRTQHLMQRLEQIIYTPFEGGVQARALYEEAQGLVSDWMSERANPL